MLKYFSVSGYKNFSELVELDFSDVRDYKFSNDCINNRLLGKMLIYGKNAVGKSNFARAIRDIIYVPVGSLRMLDDDDYYLSINSDKSYAEFRYIFKFEDNEVEYRYRKTSATDLVYEKIILNNSLLVEFNRSYPDDLHAPGLKDLAPTLILDFVDVKSVLSYIVSNTPLETEHPLRKTVSFIQNIFLHSSSEHIDLSLNKSLNYIIRENNRVHEFDDFLKIAGLEDGLVVKKDPSGVETLYFNTTPPLPFNDVASSGTKTLSRLFALYKVVKSFNNSCVLILDEYDAFFHYELAERIVRMFIELPNVQVIFTTHNTSLLTNRYMRPDCCFILTRNKLTALPNATKMEIREGHNLEKLFTGGEFDG